VGSGTAGSSPLFMQSGQTMGIGLSYPAYGEYLNGSLADVYIYGRALSSAEVAALYNVSPGTLPSTPLTIAAKATLDLNGANQQVASLSDASPGSGGSIINSAVGTTSVLTVAPTTGSATFSGTIMGSGTLGAISLVMSGSGTQVLAGSLLGPGSLSVNSGTLILSGSDSYTGGTTVNAGTLIVASSTALPDGTSLTVGAGGTFIFDPSMTGAPAVASAISPVPEPSTLALFGFAVLGMSVYHRRWKWNLSRATRC